MKAIIIAAGMGSRLQQFTADRPKCLVEVAGKPILRHQVDALRQAGIDRIAVIRGYKSQVINFDDLVYYENRAYRDNNIMLSLFHAAAEMDGAFLSSYADIIYSTQIVQGLRDAAGDIVLAVDRDWKSAYGSRDDHPVTEAELTKLAPDGHISQVGKWVDEDGAVGEFIGLAKYSARGAQLLLDTYRELEDRYKNREDAPFSHSPSFRRAYLCDLFQELINRGIPVQAMQFHGGWREIDTVEDLKRVGAELTASPLVTRWP